MMILNVYLLSEADYNAIMSINTTYPQGPQIIICDHGLGFCVEVTTLDDPLYAEWRNTLDALEPFSNRTTSEVAIDYNY